MPNESAPPIRDLPTEIEAAIEQTLRGDDFESRYLASEELRDSIRTALDDQDAALRERCERLRRFAVGEPVEIQGRYIWYELQPGDLADDLRPQEDVLP